MVLDWDELAGDVRCSSLHSWESTIATLKAGQHSYARPPKVYADPQVLAPPRAAVHLLEADLIKA